MILICPRTGRQCGLTGCTADYRSCNQWPQSISTMDDHNKSQVKRLITQSPEYAAGYKAGREAGMREAAALCQSHEPKDFTTAGIMTRAKCAEVILAAIGGDK